MDGAYRILDEPSPGTLSKLSVNPFWPLLGVMLGGPWLALPWFVVNSLAIGSATKVREIITAAVGLGGAIALTLGGFALIEQGVLDSESFQYAAIVLVVWKLGVSYWLFVTQARSFQLYEYFGGPVRNGMLLVIAAMLGEAYLLTPLSPFWQLVLS